MVFSSTIFLFVFLPLLIVVYYNPFFRSRSFRNSTILIASLGFYAWGEPVYVFLMIFSILITWVIGIRISKNGKHKKSYLIIGIAFHVLLLFIFKYFSFIAGQIGLLSNGSTPEIALPIGISFYTFQLMSYLFDIYYGKAKAQKNLKNLAIYISMFPQLIAGPIVRYNQIAAEITDRKESYADITAGMKRFIYGLAKKVLLANYMAQIADNTFDYMGSKTVLMAWIGAICYSLQIYYDFSGYSDMAIGLGRMFGFHFSENFDHPYISRSVTEFWHRWHISLSTWFRDYVYIPLGGSRVRKGRHIFNIFIVWLLTGIWHGANWTFLCWGLVYFLILIVEKMFIGHGEKSGDDKNTIKDIISHLYTLLVIVLAWVIFRSDDMSSAIAYIGNLFGIGADGIYNAAVADYIGATAIILVAAIIGATPVYKKVMKMIQEKKAGWIEPVWLFVLFVLAVLQVISSTYNPFIYFNF